MEWCSLGAITGQFSGAWDLGPVFPDADRPTVVEVRRARQLEVRDPRFLRSVVGVRHVLDREVHHAERRVMIAVRYFMPIRPIIILKGSRTPQPHRAHPSSVARVLSSTVRDCHAFCSRSPAATTLSAASSTAGSRPSCAAMAAFTAAWDVGMAAAPSPPATGG